MTEKHRVARLSERGTSLARDAADIVARRNEFIVRQRPTYLANPDARRDAKTLLTRIKGRSNIQFVYLVTSIVLEHLARSQDNFSQVIGRRDAGDIEQRKKANTRDGQRRWLEKIRTAARSGDAVQIRQYLNAAPRIVIAALNLRISIHLQREGRAFFDIETASDSYLQSVVTDLPLACDELLTRLREDAAQDGRKTDHVMAETLQALGATYGEMFAGKRCPAKIRGDVLALINGTDTPAGTSKRRALRTGRINARPWRSTGP